MDVKKAISQLHGFISKKSKDKYSEATFSALRKEKAVMAKELAGSLALIIDAERAFLGIKIKEIFFRNYYFVEAVFTHAEPTVEKNNFKKYAILEAVVSLKKMLARGYKPAVNVVDSETTAAFIIDLLALSLFYSLPGKIAPAVELRMDALLCKFIGAAESLLAITQLKAFPEAKRTIKSSQTKSQKKFNKEKILADIFMKKAEDLTWFKRTNRSDKARYILKNYKEGDLGFKSIMNFLKEVEEHAEID